MNIEHPYAPHLEWRFAISRRFSSAYVEGLYRKYILPILRGEGMVLECYYASETPKSENYWANRMDLILALADIHILIDIEPTTFTVHEIEKSLHGRKQIRTTLVRNFGERIANYHKLMGPPEILVIKESETPRPRSLSKRTTTIYLDKTMSVDDFGRNLRKEIDEAKFFKRKDLLLRAEWSKRLTPTVRKLVGDEVPLAPPDQRADWLKVYQSIARLISMRLSVDEINAAIQSSLESPVEKLAETIEQNANFDPRRLSDITFEAAFSQDFDFTEKRTRVEDVLPPGHPEGRALIDAQVAFNLKIKKEELASPKSFRKLFSVYKEYYSEYIPALLWEFLLLDSRANSFLSVLVNAVVTGFAFRRTIQAKLFRARFKPTKS